MQRLIIERGSSRLEQGGAGEKTNDGNASRFDGLAPTFLTIDENEGKEDFPACRFDGIDGLNCGSARSNDIIDDDDRVAFLEVAFDLLTTTMAFGFFANGENLQWVGLMVHRTGHADSEGNRISAHGHAANGSRMQVVGLAKFFDSSQAAATNENRALWIER